ncbi:hypothetical protein ACFQ3C_02160 [Seohaeicola saemankumensis]|uniref:ATP-binding protein n=1 Tax=Seohaeicola saemankumensis TaxID=481181 RepID=A0ABW3TAC9_9RHOB
MSTKRILVPDFSTGNRIMEFNHELMECESAILDFSGIGFAKPAGMVLLSQIIRNSVKAGKISGFEGASPYGYPANVGFFDGCLLNVPKHEAAGGETYLPLQCVDLEEWKISAVKGNIPFGELANQKVGRMAYLISRQARGDLFDLIKYCLREIVRNAMEHGDGKEMWLSGQYWPGNNEVELCIFDNGIGIRSSLAKNEKFSKVASDLDAIRLAILPSISGNRAYGSADEIDAEDGAGQWSNSGFGLYVTSQLSKNCGYFVIGSGDGYQQLSGVESKKGFFGLSGTYIAMHFNVAELGRTAARVDEVVKIGESFAKRHFASGAEVLASAASKILIQ